jgi:hypothetical protein
VSQIIQYFTESGTGTVVSVSGGHDINITGNPNVNPTVNLNNAITLGDLSVILAGSSAATLTSGDLTISGTGVGAAGNLNLPSTTSANVGVVNVGGGSWLHNFGGSNIFLGSSAGNFTLTSSTFNIGIGQSTLDDLTTGDDNVGVGVGVMDHLTSSTGNTGIGTQALNQIDQAGPGASNFNTAVGWHAGFNLEDASNNTLIGAQAGEGLVGTGSYNIVIGANAGSDYDGGEDSNICIGNVGLSTDAHTIRIGTQGGGNAQQSTCYVAGITGVTTSNSQMVTIDTTTGQLGCTAIGGGGITTINGDVSSVTGSTVTFTGGTSGAVFTGNGTTTMTESFNFLNLPNADAGGTQGYISFNTIKYMHNGGTANNSLFLGPSSGNFTHTGFSNFALGAGVLTSLQNGLLNIAIGGLTAANVTDGSANIAIGTQALGALITGSFNIGIGYNAGTNLSAAENSNIMIGAVGVLGDNNTIRIGDQGSSTGQVNKCYVAGITGVTTSNSEMVTVDTTTGQLGSAAIPGGGFTWSVITANQTADVGNGYICNKSGLLTLTLPASSAAGDIIEVTGMNTAVGWRIAQGSGQTIHFGTMDTTTGASGYLESTAIYDSVKIVCNITNTDWIVLSSEGNITVN